MDIGDSGHSSVSAAPPVDQAPWWDHGSVTTLQHNMAAVNARECPTRKNAAKTETVLVGNKFLKFIRFWYRYFVLSFLEDHLYMNPIFTCWHFSQCITLIHTRMLTVHGGWSLWGPWSECSVTCDTGMVTRTRTCDSPRPLFGGRKCDGSATDTRECTANKQCPGMAPVW